MLISNLLITKKQSTFIFIFSMTLALIISIFITFADAQDKETSEKTDYNITKVLDSYSTTFVLYAVTAFAIGTPANYVLEEMQKLAEELASDPKVKKVEIIVTRVSTRIPKINVTKFFQKRILDGTTKKTALKEVRSAVRKLHFPEYTIVLKKIFN